MGAYANFWNEINILSANGFRSAEKLDIPSFVLQCDKDTNITKKDFSSLVTATQKISNSSSKWFEGCTHLLTAIGSNRVSDNIIDSISSWIEKLVE